MASLSDDRMFFLWSFMMEMLKMWCNLFQPTGYQGVHKNSLEMLVFKERGKPEYQEKNLSEQSREPTTNSIHMWRRVWESNPGHIGGRRGLSPLAAPSLLPWNSATDALISVENQYMPSLLLTRFFHAGFYCSASSEYTLT